MFALCVAFALQATRNPQSSRWRADLLPDDGVSPTPSPQLSLDDSALEMAAHPLSRTQKASTIDPRLNRFRGHQSSAASATPAAAIATGGGALGASDKSTVGDADEAEAEAAESPSPPGAASNLRRSHSAARARSSGARHGGGRMAGLVSRLGFGGGRNSLREPRARARRDRKNEDAPAATAGAGVSHASPGAGPGSSGVSFTLEQNQSSARGVPLFLEQILEYIEMHGVLWYLCGLILV